MYDQPREEIVWSSAVVFFWTMMRRLTTASRKQVDLPVEAWVQG